VNSHVFVTGKEKVWPVSISFWVCHMIYSSQDIDSPAMTSGP